MFSITNFLCYCINGTVYIELETFVNQRNREFRGQLGLWAGPYYAKNLTFAECDNTAKFVSFHPRKFPAVYIYGVCFRSVTE